MILGIGSDIVEIGRIERILRHSEKHFTERIFTAEEIAYAASRARPALHYAARFAAKEAFVKALGSGFRNGLEWREIAVRNNPVGRPELILRGRARELCRELGVTATWLSLSHERELALAFVILEKGVEACPCPAT